MLNRRLRRTQSIIVVCILSVLLPTSLSAQDALVVSPDGPYRSIQEALTDADSGDLIEVHGGIYSAPIEITKTVSVVGVNNPVIDGGGEGSLVIITAPDVLFQGFTLRNSGTNLSHEDTAIVIRSDGVTIADNTMADVLFGIFFAEANGGIARNNYVAGITTIDVALRGDGIRLWYSSNVTLEGNEVVDGRDTLIWFCDDVRVVDNHFHHNRYGLHFMYSDGALVYGNTVEHNTIGSYLMYSTGLTMQENILSHSRGNSGYGLALKDMDDVTAVDNLIVGNRTGVFIDNSPSSIDSFNEFTGNVFSQNDVGITALPSSARNIFQSNAFLENTQQARAHGRGNLQGNVWSQDNLGNYWSDYAGYDSDGDQVGDMPYRSEKLFESLTDAHPNLQFFLYSPASQAINFAAAAFPSLRPDPKLIDDAPLMAYSVPERFVRKETAVSGSLLVISLLMATLGGGICLFAVRFALPGRE